MMSLDNGFRSKCHMAPVRIGFKSIKHSKHRIKVWVCTRCHKRDVDIVSREEIESQTELDKEFDSWEPDLVE